MSKWAAPAPAPAPGDAAAAPLPAKLKVLAAINFPRHPVWGATTGNLAVGNMNCSWRDLPTDCGPVPKQNNFIRIYTCSLGASIKHLKFSTIIYILPDTYHTYFTMVFHFKPFNVFPHSILFS